MIRIGVCTSPDNINTIAKAGFDFIEVGFAWLHGLSDEEYQKVLDIAKSAPIGIEACNGMLPGDLKVVGPEVDEAAVRTYLEKAFARAQAVGVKVVVFGSGASRRVPDGFPQDEAWRQIARYLTIVSEYCEKYGIDLAIEPLRRMECNIMNLVTEGTMMAALVNKPGIGVLGDTYHMNCGHEPYSALTQAGKLLRHVHISHCIGIDQGRDFPTTGDDGDYKDVFAVLNACGYEGRVSIEAGCSDLETGSIDAFRVLDEARRA